MNVPPQSLRDSSPKGEPLAVACDSAQGSPLGELSRSD